MRLIDADKLKDGLVQELNGLNNTMDTTITCAIANLFIKAIDKQPTVEVEQVDGITGDREFLVFDGKLYQKATIDCPKGYVVEYRGKVLNKKEGKE